MSLQIVKGDITKIRVDAIVDPTDEIYSGSGGTDLAIHLAGGPELAKACRRLDSIKAGEVRITSGFDLPARYVIHTVGPRWKGGNDNERETLCQCYRNALNAACDLKLESIAFPLLASGTFGYPKQEAIESAVNTIRGFLDDHDMIVYLVVYDKEALRVSIDRYGEVQSIIEMRSMVGCDTSGNILEQDPDQYRIPFEQDTDLYMERFCSNRVMQKSVGLFECDEKFFDAERSEAELGGYPKEPVHDLKTLLKNKDESFAQALIRMIDSRNMTDAQCYKKANVDKQLFNKIKNKKGYRPQKSTVIALAFALEPTKEELDDLVTKAGYSITGNNDFDIIIGYCFENGIIDVLSVNDILFQFDQQLLGSIAKEPA